MAQPLFNFLLRPVNEIQPWGTAPNLSLSWDAFTLGSYWLHLGDQELFRYTDEAIRHWELEAQLLGNERDFLGDPYDTYLVSRLESYFNDLTFQALEPVPLEVQKFIPKIELWESEHAAQRAADRVARKPIWDRTPDEELFDEASYWWFTCRLNTWYLAHAPINNHPHRGWYEEGPPEGADDVGKAPLGPLEVTLT